MAKKKLYLAYDVKNQPILDKLVVEYDELDSKIIKLQKFVFSKGSRKKVTHVHFQLLLKQLYSMIEYSSILDARINDLMLNYPTPELSLSNYFDLKPNLTFSTSDFRSVSLSSSMKSPIRKKHDELHEKIFGENPQWSENANIKK